MGIYVCVSTVPEEVRHPRVFYMVVMEHVITSKMASDQMVYIAEGFRSKWSYYLYSTSSSSL